MTYPSINISDPNTWMVPRKKVDGDWIAHVRCEGARFHVLSWDTIGVRCSEKMCIVNKIYNERKEKVMTEVVDLNTGDIRTYSCKPEEAVIAAYAQSLGDWNTWDYAEKYGDQVVRGNHTISCGDFSAFL